MLTLTIEQNYYLPTSTNNTASKFGNAIDKLLALTKPDWLREIRIMQKVAAVLEPRSRVSFLRSAMFSSDSTAYLASQSQIISNVLSAYRLVEDIFNTMQDQGVLSAGARGDAVRVLEVALTKIVFDADSSRGLLGRIQENLLLNSQIADILQQMDVPALTRIINEHTTDIQKRIALMATMELLGTKYKTGSTTW
jgi:hypothetical protein